MKFPKLNRTLIVGTDVAGLFLFHPDELSHRMTSPVAWYGYGFACGKEFTKGRLVTFSTGGDGGYKVRLTTGSLTEREENWIAGSWEFRLRVRYDRVLLEGGYCLPCDDCSEPPDEEDEAWVDLPNGHYRVTVHSIEWGSEPGATDEDGRGRQNALPAYVIRFTPVEDIRNIPVASLTQPTLECSKNFPPNSGYDHASVDNFEESKETLTCSEFPLLVTSKWQIVPGSYEYLDVPESVFQAVFGSEDGTMLPDRFTHFVLGPPDAKPGQVLVLARGSSSSRSRDGQITMAFPSERLVKVTERRTADEWDRVRVEPNKRLDLEASDESVEDLKTAFEEFAGRDSAFRRKFRTADFEAERVRSMTSVEAVTNSIIRHLPLTGGRRIELLVLSNAERVVGLLKELRKLDHK